MHLQDVSNRPRFASLKIDGANSGGVRSSRDWYRYREPHPRGACVPRDPERFAKKRVKTKRSLAAE
jgi:hypothetical protein